MKLSQSFVKKFFYDTGNFVDMKKCFTWQNWPDSLSDKPVEEMWEIISENITCAVDNFVPRRLIQPRNCCRQNRKSLWMNGKALSRIKR